MDADTDGITLLKEWSESGNDDAPVIMMSGHGTVETAVEATRLEAYDFIEKPLSMAKLLTVRNALTTAGLTRERSAAPSDELSIDSLGRGSQISSLREQLSARLRTRPLCSFVAKAAVVPHWPNLSMTTGQDVTVLSRGLQSRGSPTTTVMRFVQRRGRRSCSLHALEEANGGTLFLDDIMTCRRIYKRGYGALESRRSHALAARSPCRWMRIIVATTQDLATAVNEGQFRNDLYLIQVIPLMVPPLRQHLEDSGPAGILRGAAHATRRFTVSKILSR